MWKGKGKGKGVSSCRLKILLGSSGKKSILFRGKYKQLYFSVCVWGGGGVVFNCEDWSVLRTPLGKWTVWSLSSSKLSCKSHLPSGKAWHDWAVSGRGLGLEQWKNTGVCQIGIKIELTGTQNSVRGMGLGWNVFVETLNCCNNGIWAHLFSYSVVTTGT